MKFSSILKKILIIVALGAVLFFGMKWFAGMANDDLKDYDGNRGKYEEQIENI